jgi:hypothetical protein
MLADIFASPRPAASFIPFGDSFVGSHLSHHSSGPEGRLYSKRRCLISGVANVALTFVTSILLLSLLAQVSREE